MTEEFNAQEIHFVKQAVENVQVSGKDSMFVATVLVKINKSLELSTPFIVENGACIFFPKSYLKYVRDKNFFLYKNHLGFKVFKGNLSASNKKINELKKDYKFNFLSDLDDKKIMEIYYRIFHISRWCSIICIFIRF